VEPTSSKEAQASTPAPSEKKARGRPKKVDTQPTIVSAPIDETTLTVEESTANPITVIKPKKPKQPAIFAILKKEKKAEP
jgi:hypothetical protein